MQISDNMNLALKLGSGLLWTLTYILIIIKGHRDKTYGMPLLALCLNLSWEFIFAFLFPHKPPQNIINMIWFSFDLIIAYQFIRYAKIKMLIPSFRRNAGFKASVCAIICFVILYDVTTQLPDLGGYYSAFTQNLLMSILFCFMIWHRKNLEGQSLYIAIFKMLGTILPSILFYSRYPENFYLNTMYLSILFFDGLYIYQILRQLKKEKYKESSI